MNNIIYPYFLECFKYTNDSFWKNIFDDLAHGKSPYGTYINKGYLCCNYKQKQFTYKIERKHPKILYDELYNLLTNKIGILSNTEKNNMKNTYYMVERLIKNENTLENKLKKKTIKDLLIEKFIINKCKKYNISESDKHKLLNIILLSFVFKKLSNKDIIYNNNSIIGIEGLKFRNKKYIYDHDKLTLNKKITPNIKFSKKNLNDLWEKYLLNLKKRMKT